MTDDKMLDYLRKVTAELQDTRRRLDEARALAREPIAVVGTACRFPGGVDSSADLWDLVAGGVDAMARFPQDRGWDLAAFAAHGPLPVGGFLDDAAGFDPGFFGISPREAFAMDPQQRLALECCYQALEHAGLDVSRLRGSDTAVYLGTNGQDYPMLLGATAGADTEGHVATGNIASVLSGRISYALGLEGPAVSVDTACSSSLVALHLASRALRAGECSLALVGGVTVMATPGAFIEFARQGGLASDGRCKAFAEGADGTGWGEGAGILVVERLSDAQRNGHRVLAVIRGSAVNSDGASNGLTAPNGPSQRRVIARALADAGLRAADVDVVEAHGTGTALGDPIEAQALLAGYGGERAEPVYLGSVKSNIGHTQAAAGVAGVLKMIEALNHGEIPRTLHAEPRTTRVDWSAGPVELATEHRAWPQTGRPRRAAVSAFGISGTNAHVIVEQAPESAADAEPGSELLPDRPADVPVPWIVSGADPAALTANLARLAGLDADPVDVGWALATTRSRLAERAVLVGGSTADLLAAAPVRGRAAAGRRVGVVFSGQGAQRPGMGRALAARFPVFGKAFDEVLGEFGPGVREALDDERVHRTEYAQPGLFAFEVAQYRLLESWGVRPQMLVGHSVGELAAAYLAGVWSLPDACRLVAARARLMGALPEGGAMVALAGTEAAVRAVLTAGVSIAAVNGPDTVVVSGEEAEVLAIADAWPGKTSRLRVSRAFHSALMEPMLEEFGAVARSLHYAPPTLPVVSNVTGRLAEQLTEPDYWVRQVREAVRFADGVATLLDAGMDALAEVGPRAALSGAITEIVAGRPVAVAPLGRDEDEVRAALAGAGRLWAAGVEVDWAETFAGLQPQRTDLPGYAFQRERFWPAAPAAPVGDVSAAGLARADHPLLGAVVGLADGGWVLSGRLARDTRPWLSDHAVLGAVLLPGTGFVELALRAGELVGCDGLEDLTLAAPLLLPEHGGVHIQVVLRDREVRIYSSAEDAGPDEWTTHATGILADSGARSGHTDAPDTAWAATWPPPGAQPLDITGFYEGFALGGFDYGPAFRGLAAAWRGGSAEGEVFVEADLPEPAGPAEDFGLHPALLDVVLQSIGLLAQGGSRVPFAWEDVHLAASGARRIRARLRLREGTLDGGVGLTVVDTEGGLVLSAGRVTVREVSREQLAPAAGRSDALLELHWSLLELPETAGAIAGARGVVLGEDVFGLAIPAPLPDEAPAFAVLTVSGGDPGEQLARVLGEVQRWLADASLAAAHLVVVTRDAVVIDDSRPGEPAPVDLAGAAIWGLIRTVASENPGRVTLVDADEASLSVWPKAMATGAPQLALREGRCWTPALARLTADQMLDEPGPISGPVLITGGTGGLGSLVARHLVAAHGIRKLILLSRSGETTPELRQELEAAGAVVRIAACDVTDRAALTEALADSGRIGAVIHTAGILDDATIESLTPRRLTRVLAPKLRAAELLDELTVDHDLSHFLVFSSVSGVLGTAGQGNYAAANTALDALIQRRRAAGRPGTSLAWGPWSASFGMTSGLSDADISRMRRGGVVPFTGTTGMAAFDAALRAAPALLVPVITAPPGSAVDVSPMLAGVVRPARRSAAAAASGPALAERLRALPAERRADAVVEYVRAEVATVLGHASADRIDPQRLFGELGFDSLTAVELRNRLGAAGAVRLSSTVVFDYPTVTALAEHLLEQIDPDSGAPRTDRYRYALATAPAAAAATGPADVSALPLSALYRQAAGARREDEAMALITGLAAFRPTFAAAADLAELPLPLPISRGPAAARLVCLPSFFGRSGPQEYVRLAGRFQGVRPLSVLTDPGFRQGEPLPATLADLVRVQAEILSRAPQGGPLVLLGHSSGGLIAHALARHLEDAGRPPAGLVLLDTFPPPTDGLTGFRFAGLLDAALEHNDHDVDDDAWLTAMAHYFRFAWLEPGQTHVPTLQAGASAAINGATDPANRPAWVFSRHTTSVQVPGDHFSMMGEHVHSTAAAIEQWLTEIGA
ncbi:MAG TPA: type I polyketide synthase [Actinocrinis sp.]|nr:type I polyketide synthase [Actinocrinis sp.]